MPFYANVQSMFFLDFNKGQMNIIMKTTCIVGYCFLFTCSCQSCVLGLLIVSDYLHYIHNIAFSYHNNG